MLIRWVLGNKPMIIIYVHIPKTAGTSLRVMLEAYAGAERLFSAYPGDDPSHAHLGDWSDLPAAKQLGYRAALGHYSYGAFDAIIQNPQKYFITFLRNPIDRIISLYKHTLVTHPAYVNSEAKLADFLNDPDEDIRIQIDNHQTRMVAGTPNQIPITRESFERALSNMKDNFGFIGLTEHFAQDVANLASHIQAAPPLERVNVSIDRRTRDDFSEADLHEIRQRNFFDFQIFEFAAVSREHVQRSPPGNSAEQHVG
jgi:hypothetical protein